jgi:hypothetical protein
LIAASVQFFAADSGCGIVSNSDFELWNDLLIWIECRHLIANHNGLDASGRRWCPEPMRMVRNRFSEVIAVKKHTTRISYDPFR